MRTFEEHAAEVAEIMQLPVDEVVAIVEDVEKQAALNDIQPELERLILDHTV